MFFQLPPTPLRALFVEDNEDDAFLLARHLRKAGYLLETARVDRMASLTEALCDARGWDVVISDYALPGFSAQQVLEAMQACTFDIPLIVVSGVIDENTACQLMGAGAQDYLLKDKLDRLVPVIERERREAQFRRERREALEAVRISEARFRAMAANVPGVLFQMREEEDGALRFLYISEASQMLLGKPGEAILAQPNPLLDLIVAEDREDFLCALKEAGERKGTLNWEGRIHLPGSDTKWINLRCSPRTPHNGRLQWEGVMWNITQSKVAEADLRTSRGQLAELSDHLQRVKEEERDRIARDIHDVLGGTLVGIKISAALLASKLEHESALRSRVIDIETMLDEAITVAGRVARELRPGILREFGLAAAVESYAEDYQHRTGTPCHILCADHDIETSEDTALALFRIYQEALTNITKHAAATQIEVRLMQEGDEIVLEIRDNGRGMRPEDLTKPKSFGLRSIRERLARLGGSLSIQANTPSGTAVILRARVTQSSAT